MPALRMPARATGQVDGMVERFNGRVQWAGLGLTLYSHSDREVVPRGFTVAYHGRRQCLLKDLSAETVLRRRPGAEPALAIPAYRPPGPRIIERALRIVAGANEVSRADSDHRVSS